MLFNVSEEEPAPLVLKKEQTKNLWDDEDVDENDIKESWEDEDEPAPVFYYGLSLKCRVYYSSYAEYLTVFLFNKVHFSYSGVIMRFFHSYFTCLIHLLTRSFDIPFNRSSILLIWKDHYSDVEFITAFMPCI